MKFEDCRKVMLQYIKAKQAMEKLMKEHCKLCSEKCCHCSECPMLVNGECDFP